MSFGKIYSYPNNPRVQKSLIAAKYNNLVIDLPTFVFGETNTSTEFMQKFPVGKVPVFEGADGFVLFESSAIAQYVASSKEGTQLLGKNKKEAALVSQFVSYADNEFVPIVSAWIYPIMGYFVENKAATDKAKENCKRALKSLNTILSTRTFLVGETVTLADIALSTTMLSLYTMVLEPAFMSSFNHVTRWFTTCINQPNFKSVLGDVKFCEKMQVYKAAAPKAEKAAKPAKQAKPAAEEEEDLEAIAAAEEKPKEKNPLDLLPKSSFVLDDWKRFYSNNDTRPTAIDWFWKNYDPTGYSIWKCDYKYNSELTQIFMSSNLVGGFFQRLDRSRKYAFGSVLILGEDNKNQITGYFVFRGHGVPFEVTDAADYDSYSFTRMDDQSPKARESFNSVIAWDAPKFQDGKVFK